MTASLDVEEVLSKLNNIEKVALLAGSEPTLLFDTAAGLMAYRSGLVAYQTFP